MSPLSIVSTPSPAPSSTDIGQVAPSLPDVWQAANFKLAVPVAEAGKVTHEASDGQGESACQVLSVGSQSTGWPW